MADILTRLLETEGGPGQPSAVLGSKHLISWGFEDQLSLSASNTEHTVKEAKEAAEKDKDKGVCVCVCAVSYTHLTLPTIPRV